MPTAERRDGPVLMLRTCVLMFGAVRPEWGQAMLVELAQIDGRRSRWGFALGCVRSLAFTMPPSGSARVVTWGALVAALGSLSLVTFGFLQFPGVVSGARTWIAVAIVAAVLGAYVVGAINAAARVADTRLTFASTFAGALIALSWLAVGLNSSVGGSAGLTVALLVVGPIVALAIGCLATARSGSSRVVLGCIGHTAVVAGFALFLTWTGWTVATAGRPYDAGLLRDFKSSGFVDFATYAVNDSLGTGMVLLVVVPLLSAAGGLAGAAAARIRSTDQRTSGTP
jgi:hypothetical protein